MMSFEKSHIETIFAKRTAIDTEMVRRKWVEKARNEKVVSLTTHKGLSIVVHRVPLGSKVEYKPYTEDGRLLGRFYSSGILAGRARITDADVYNHDDRRSGIATAVYDLVESDIKDAGGLGIEPDWGRVSTDGIAFWKNRRSDIDIERLNNMGPDAWRLFD